VCVKGNIGQSNNTSTACVDIIINPNLTPIDGDVETGFVDVFHYEVTDGDKHSKPGIIIITIGWENTPAEVSDLAISTLEDTPTSGQLQGSDLDGHPITFSIVDSASMGTVTLDDTETGAFSYTPNPNAYGVDTFTYVANDGFENSQTGTVTITVENTNDAPVAHFTGILTTLEDTAVNGTLGVTDPDEEDVMDFRLATLPSKGEVVITNAQTGAFTYTPHQDLNGSDSFFFVVHDGEIESNAAKVNIEITPVNDAPVSEDVGLLTTHTDETLTDTLTATDVDEDALLYKIVSSPAKGSVDLDAATGVFTYTTSCTSECTDSFTYSASDAYVSSALSTVSIIVKQANLAPVCNELAPIDVFAGVAYGGAVSCSDPDGGELTYIVVNKGRLGAAAFPDPANGDYVYTPNPLATGSDYITVIASDGDKESNPVTVQVEISNVCQGPGNAKRDADDDGYADFVEQAFDTAADNINETPLNLDPRLYPGAMFAADFDGDGYDDIAELWLDSDHRSNASIPSLSTLKGVPDCLTALYDTVPPALFGFSILTPVVDATPGDATARFALTAVDNAAGIVEVNILLESPSGTSLAGKATFDDKPLVTYVEFESDTFSQYAEAGTWIVKTLSVIDSMGNGLYFSTEDLASRQYATTLEVINNNPQNSITLGDLKILTPSVDVCSEEVASVQAVATSDYLGIKRVAVSLRSPSGENYSWGEITPANPQTSLTATINTFAYRIFSETGDWQIAELTLSDVAGGTVVLDTAALQAGGYATTINVYKSGLCPVEDNPTILHNFEVATPIVSMISDSADLGLDLYVSDQDGISEMTINLEGPSGETMAVQQQSPTVPTSFAQIIEHAILSQDLLNYKTCTGNIPWNVKSISVADGYGNVTAWDETQLIELGHITDQPDFYIYVPSSKVYTCHSLYAYNDSIRPLEDNVYTGFLPNGYDSLGHSLTYVIESQGGLGTVTITDATTGEYTYTPAANVNVDLNGEDSFKYKVNDGSADSNTATVTVIIEPTDDPTEIEDQTIQVDQDTTYTGSVVASDADLLPLTYDIVSNGQKGTATFLTNNTFQYVPNPGETGNDEFTFQVSDENSTSRLGTVSVTINPILTGATGFSFTPTRVSSCVATARMEVEIPHSRSNSEYTQVQLTLEGPSGQVIGFSATPQGSDNVFKLVNEIQTASIQGGFEPGVWVFKNLLAKRQGETYSQVVLADFEAAGFAASMEVVENCPPAADDADYTMAITETLRQTLTASDPEGDAVTYRIVDQPGKGSITDFNEQTGEFTFVPSEIGTDTFTFVANDGLSDSNVPGEVTITIVYEEPPVAYDADVTVTKNLAYVGKLNAYDADSDNLTYTIVEDASLGVFTITDTSTGAFEYRPNPGVTGEDSFRFKANDGDIE
jgi:VCBS repeat-containing protein